MTVSTSSVPNSVALWFPLEHRQSIRYQRTDPLLLSCCRCYSFLPLSVLRNTLLVIILFVHSLSLSLFLVRTRFTAKLAVHLRLVEVSQGELGLAAGTPETPSVVEPLTNPEPLGQENGLLTDEALFASGHSCLH